MAKGTEADSANGEALYNKPPAGWRLEVIGMFEVLG
jgi:hypothetical protein